MNLENFVKTLSNNDGATFKNGEVVRYKTGWQVGIKGIIRKTAKATAKAIKKYDVCGIWLSDGIYYVDVSKRTKTKKEAIELGKKYNQQSIYCWKNGKLTWL